MPASRNGGRRIAVGVLLALSVFLMTALAPGAGAVPIQPPWCGTPVPDAAGSLPDGTGATDPVGSFPHIPYYAIGCTLDAIKAESIGDRMTVEVFGHSAQGRPMYLVTINELSTKDQRKDFENWRKLRHEALKNPAKAQKELAKDGDNVKVPIFIQSAIHGNEYEGVDAMFQLVNKLATTPYGVDPEVDAILDHVILVWNTDQNPDGRALGQRPNGNGFDLNRDYLTQSQPEVQASVSVMQEWLFPDMLDQHGYVTPTLIEATTKPHNPGIDYDLWLKWNQPRTLANKVALAAVGLGAQRPINEWCANADLPPFGSSTCPGGGAPGPAVAEGWDDWGPFYGPMYNQLVGLNGSTVEMCSSTSASTTSYTCGLPGSTSFPRGRAAARLAQYTVATSTLAYDLAHRQELLNDMLEIYRRGVDNEPRPPCCDAPFNVANNWMVTYPKAYVIPLGDAQRSEPEANRLAGWLLTNGIEVSRLEHETTFGSKTFAKDSYVVWMDQPHRGLADTALSVGVDISSQIGVLYAPPAAWSHGYLWGASVETIPASAAFAPKTHEVDKVEKLKGGVVNAKPKVKEPNDRYILALDSPTAVRTLNALVGDGLTANFAMQPFTAAGRTFPAGTVVFGSGNEKALDKLGKEADLWFYEVSAADLPPLPTLDPIDRVPRIAVLTGGLTQQIWVMRNLGFTADPISTATLNTAATDPLANYDVVFNQAAWPSAANPTARARLTAFFAAHGGYIGTGTNGAGFLTTGLQVTGLTAASRSGNGRSGIVWWENAGGASSPIVGSYPSRDTAIMDPPTWITAVPATMSVDGRLASTNFFAAGLWLLDAQSASAPGSAVIVHGLNTAGTARLTEFAMDPLYRADPEREWPMFSSAAYWADQ